VLSADSIWMYFAQSPRDGLKARVDWFPVGPLRIYADAVADFYGTPLNPNAGSTYSIITGDPASWPSNLSYGAGGGAALRVGSFRALLDATFKTGYGGRQIWFDLNGGYVPLGGVFTAEARVSFANITDQVSALLKGNYTGVQVYAS